eukprot:jgi/Tetstr1/428031/TSEL_001815.t1
MAATLRSQVMSAGAPIVAVRRARPLAGQSASRGAIGCGSVRRGGRGAVAAGAASERVGLPVEELTPESFAPFGQVCAAQEDGKVFDGADAQLVLSKGTPRFYIMRLPTIGTTFNRITYHQDVTQCLGCLTPHPWYIAVAAPTSSLEAYPQQGDLHLFRVPHGTFIKMHEATWHAGPLFEGAEYLDFYNLELADTNVVDHNTHEYEGTEFYVQL